MGHGHGWVRTLQARTPYYTVHTYARTGAAAGTQCTVLHMTAVPYSAVQLQCTVYRVPS
jgi:hypothetical protein